MALIPVRSTQPINGEHIVTEVGEEHLQRWPEGYTPLTGDDLARYELQKAGVADEHLEQAIAATVALVAETEAAAATVAADQPSDSTGETDPAAPTDPTV